MAKRPKSSKASKMLEIELEEFVSQKSYSLPVLFVFSFVLFVAPFAIIEEWMKNMDNTRKFAAIYFIIQGVGNTFAVSLYNSHRESCAEVRELILLVALAFNIVGSIFVIMCLKYVSDMVNPIDNRTANMIDMCKEIDFSKKIKSASFKQINKEKSNTVIIVNNYYYQ
jgi:hypothetical protein